MGKLCYIICCNKKSKKNFFTIFRPNLILFQKRPDVKILFLAPRIVTSVKWLLRDYRAYLTSTLHHGGTDGGQTPSSGIIAVFILLQMCDSLDLYGFGSSESSKVKYHYYAGVGHRLAGSAVHNWNVEKYFLTNLHDEGFLKLF